MKDNTVYLLYNTNASNINVQNKLVKNGSLDWAYLDKDKFTITYNPEDGRKSTENKIHSKTKLKDRPKTAGEVIMPKIKAEGIIIKRSVSLSNIEDFFLKRHVPLIKPLLSEREILNLQLLTEQCRKKRTGKDPDKTSLQDVDLEGSAGKDIGPGFQPETDEEKSKAKDGTSPFLNSRDKSGEDNIRIGDKIQKSIEEGKNEKELKKSFEVKKLFDKSKSSPERVEKKDKSGSFKKGKQRGSIKGKAKQKSASKGEQKAKRIKETISTESGLKTRKGEAKSKPETKHPKTNSETKPSKTNSDIKPLKTKDKISKSEEKIHGEDQEPHVSDKSSKHSSKQKIKSEQSEKDILLKRSSGHPKDMTSQGGKSDKSAKSGSDKSKKKSDSAKHRMEKEMEGQDLNDELEQMKSQNEGSTKTKDVYDGGNKSKPGTISEGTSNQRIKDKPSKSFSGEKPQKGSGGKSVKFPNVFQHIIHYVLSNPQFVKLGWTLAPSDRAQLQVVTFRAIPSALHTSCFRERTEDEIKYYSKTLEKVAYHFRTDGTGEIFYPSGVPAATITKHSTGMRFTLYSEPKNDPLISDSFSSKVLAIFDSYGNGVVYDMQGKKLLNYNQLEGIFHAPNRNSPNKWQWCDYKILDKQRIKALLRYMAKEQKQTKKSAAPSIGFPKKAKSDDKKPEVDEAYEQILAELPYPVPQKTKTKSENHYWGFKPITLKLNSEMALRINGQEDVSVSFSSNQIFLRIDLGVRIDPDVVERIEALEPKRISDVPCVFDGLLDLSPSLQQLLLSQKPKAAPKKNFFIV